MEEGLDALIKLPEFTKALHFGVISVNSASMWFGFYRRTKCPHPLQTSVFLTLTNKRLRYNTVTIVLIMHELTAKV